MRWSAWCGRGTPVSTEAAGTQPRRPDGAPTGWRALEPVVLRMAGYPFGWLDELGSAAAAASAAALAAAYVRLEAARGALRESRQTMMDAGGYQLMRAVEDGRRPTPRAMRALRIDLAPTGVRALAEDLLSAHDGLEQAEATFAGAYELAWEQEAAAVVHRFRDDPALRDALLVSNQEFHETVAPWLDAFGMERPSWRKADRSRLDRLVLYLQRVCAKNDTTSHFGPFAVGRFDVAEPALSARPAPARRTTVMARWAADALARRAAEDPAVWPALRPRPAPGAAMRGGMLRVVRFEYGSRTGDLSRAVRLDPASPLAAADAALLRLCTGDRTVAELAAAVGEPLLDVVERLRDLERRGALVCGPEIPYGEGDPLRCLHTALDGPGAARWTAALDELERGLAALRDATFANRSAALGALRERFVAAANLPADRGRRGYYSDHALFTEECDGAVADLRVGAPVLDLVDAELGLACDLYLVLPRRRLRARRELLSGWLARRFGAGCEVPVDRYLEAFLTDLPTLQPAYERLEAELRDTAAALERELVPDHAWEEPAADLDTDAVAAGVRRHGVQMPAACNPDLLVELREGGLEVVVGEIHLGEENLTHGLFAPYVGRRFPRLAAEVAAAYRDLLEDDEELADVTLRHRNKTFARVALPCLEVEACDRSPLQRALVTPLHQLTVWQTPRGPRLRAPGHDRFLRLVALPLAWLGLAHNPFDVFGFPQDAGRLIVGGAGRPHVPRLRLGRLVLQRRLWRVPAAELAAGGREEGFVRVQALRERRGLVRRVYARYPGEPKPVYCDLDSPLLVRQLTRMAAAAGEGTVELSEMLPAPPALWLRDDRGARTSELRCALFGP